MSDEGSLSDFAEVSNPIRDTSHPKDWHPHVDRSSETGSGVVTTADYIGSEDELEARLLRESDADPAIWSIRNVAHRKWQRYDLEWIHYWKFDLVKRINTPGPERVADIEEIKRSLEGPAPEKTDLTGRFFKEHNDALVMIASDWQIGKGEGGGTEGTVNRWMAAVEEMKIHVDDLRRIGYKVPTLALFGTGDLHEQVCGFYAAQLFQVDLNKRDQAKVVRRMVTYAVRELAPLFDDVLVSGVGGNHGEASRVNGKQATDFADNDDVAALEVVQEVLQETPGYDHVRFEVPSHERDICLNVSGVSVGLAHGDQFTGGGKLVQAKALEWWKGQTFGFQSCHNARILISSHFHHFSCIVHGPRTHFQTPALDGGSRWFKDTSGMDAPPGVLVLRLDAETRLGWDHARILAGDV